MFTICGSAACSLSNSPSSQFDILFGISSNLTLCINVILYPFSIAFRFLRHRAGASVVGVWLPGTRVIITWAAQHWHGRLGQEHRVHWWAFVCIVYFYKFVYIVYLYWDCCKFVLRCCCENIKNQAIYVISRTRVLMPPLSMNAHNTPFSHHTYTFLFNRWVCEQLGQQGGSVVLGASALLWTGTEGQVAAVCHRYVCLFVVLCRDWLVYCSPGSVFCILFF